ncbi:MAG: peptidase C39 family protein [Candidatus Zixiibacteriota bacterium]
MTTVTCEKIRIASQHDLDALVSLERTGFATDRFTEEQIEYLLTRAHAIVFVLEFDGKVVGGAYMLWRRALGVGRLYNIVTDPAYQGRGFGAKLLAECELEATRRYCDRISLEVRVDNHNAIKFYENRGYRAIETLRDYYEDGSAGLKMVKPLPRPATSQVRLKVPYFAQGLDFTCGPASLMMAMHHLRPDIPLSRTLELNLWKEATLIFMTSGIGGTGPYGLALSAVKRGLWARVLVSTEKPPFLKSVRIPKKREIIRIVHEDIKESAVNAGAAVAQYDFALDDITSAIYRGMVPIMLISTYRLTGDRAPHWVVVTGFDKDGFYIHDPDVESYGGDSSKARNLKVSTEEFFRMSRYGKDVFRCAILIGR